MPADHALVCPGCRTQTPAGLALRTLDRVGDVLACECGRRYPIVDGVPIVLADPDAFMRAETVAIVERDVSTEVATLLAEGGPDDAPYPRLLAHLSTYLDAHWGDRATPPPNGPGGTFGAQAVVERIAARAAAPVATAVELGCSVGRMLGELAIGAAHVVGVELQIGALRRARQLLAGERLAYHRRAAGRHYTPAHAVAGDRAVAADRVTLVCADALDPPLIPAVFGRVVALNLLDSVWTPRTLLSVIDGLCAPHGEVILSSPYTWKSGVVAEAARLGGADPAVDLAAILRDGTGLGARYVIEDEADLPWTLRLDARSAATYCIHYVRARRT